MYKEMENEAGTNPKPENKPVLGDLSTILQKESVEMSWTKPGRWQRIVIRQGFSYKASKESIEKNLVVSPYAKVDEMAGIPK